MAKIDERNDPIIEKDSILNRRSSFRVPPRRKNEVEYVQAANTTRRDEPNDEGNGRKETRRTTNAITTTVYDAASQSIKTIVSLGDEGEGYARGEGAEGGDYKLEGWQQMCHGWQIC